MLAGAATSVERYLLVFAQHAMEQQWTKGVHTGSLKRYELLHPHADQQYVTEKHSCITKG
jgi:hypothetical protein